MHTPGPWKVDSHAHHTSAVTESGSALLIAVVTDYEYDPMTPCLNACLVAAAPDLLAACEAMIHAAKMNDSALGATAATLAETAVAKAAPE